MARKQLTDADFNGNNITNVGTVDGRDVATDGNKLDGVQAGAQVNSFVRVVHGATASTARPAGVTHVEWVGSIAPTNGTAADTWIDTA